MSCSSWRSWRQAWAGRLLLALAAPAWLSVLHGRADVIVVANRTSEAIAFHALTDPDHARPMRVAADDLTVLRLRGTCQIALDDQPNRPNYQLDANSVYLLEASAVGQVGISQVDLGSDPQTAGGRALGTGPLTPTVAEIPVEVLVDNFEPTRQEVWEPRLRRRIEHVSAILEHYCGVRLKVVQVGQWSASKEAIQLQQALAEFRQRVTPQPGHVAIGFTGRYRQPMGVQHLGGTPGMLQSHILVREWSATMSEPEREEVLLHEVAHYLGAVHSPDTTSVMRPLLADDQALRASFRIRFDPVNALLINLVGEEIRERHVTGASELTAGTRRRLSQIYAKLSDAIPDDASARQYQFQVGAAEDMPLADATRRVVQAVRAAAEARVADAGAPQGDRLTEHYVRCAADAVQGLPADVAPAALLLGLGIALDESETLLRNPLTRALSLAAETPRERQQRCAALARPSLLGRHDLAQHFFLSGYLAAAVGPAAAEAAGIAKELADARAGSGWSYADLQADLAGIAFAQRVLRRDVTLPQLARQFTVAQVMPAVEGLPEGVRWPELESQLAGDGPDSFATYRRTMRDRLAQLQTAAGTQDKGE
jgi:hypothetical protein